MVRIVSSFVLGVLTVFLPVTPLGVPTAFLPAAPMAARAAGNAEPVREVVGGNLAPAGRFPWMVRLSMGCGGVLTAPDVVLTAGHCVTGSGKDETIAVTAGATDLKSESAVKARSVKVYRAARFQDETRGNDWALIKLDHRLNLPVLGLSRGGADETGPLTIVGWGQTSENSTHQQNKLRYGTVSIVGDKACARAYRKVGVKLVENHALCAARRGVDTCQGDSGGPLVHQTADHHFVQVGIVSFGLGCARNDYPGVYTQISTFRARIRDATRKLS
jgi:secreted trypsin-like serine protease